MEGGIGDGLLRETSFVAFVQNPGRNAGQPDIEFRLPRLETKDASDDGGRDDSGEAPIAEGMIYTMPSEVLRQTIVCDAALSRYEKDLETMKGCCLLCQFEGRPWEHTASSYARRWG